jgi:peroxiredoxin
MSKQTELNSRYHYFLVKSAACLFGLLLGFFVLAPKVSMQDEEVVTTTNANVPVIVNNNKTITNMRLMSNYKPTPEPPKSTIRGRVIYADTGRAVRRAGLMLLSAKNMDGGGKDNAGLTNELGEFEIKDVTEGKYFISVSTPGVLTPFSSISNFLRGGGQDKSVLADVAKDFQEIVVNGINDTEVIVVVKRGAVITGKIMYADGEAAIGVRVEVLRKKDGQYNAVVPNMSEIFGAIFGGAAGGLKTDDRGIFRVAGLPAGDYLVRVVENVSHSEVGKNRDDEFLAISGFNRNSMVSTYYPSTSDVKKAEVVKVEIGQEQSEVNITIPERILRNLSGTVVNKATREPLKNARVSIKSEDDVNSLFSSMPDFGSKNETDEKGRWNYKELPAGKYTLTVSPPYDYESSDEKNSQKVKTPKFAAYQKEIIIGEKDITDFVAELGYGATVSGTISFESGQILPARMTVSILEEEGKASESDSIGDVGYDDGSREKTAPKKSADFKMEGLPAGKFSFYVSGGLSYGETEKAEEFYVKSIRYGGKDITNTVLETKESEELKGVQIILSKDAGKIKGKVLNKNKTAAVGAKIFFVSTDKQKWGNFNSMLFVVTGSDGEFETSGAPGEYFVFTLNEEDFNDEEGKSAVEKRRAWLEGKTKDARKITVKAKEIEKITLTLPEKQ